MNDIKNKMLSEYFAALGHKGGKTTGASKVRGDSEYYKKIAAKRKGKKKNGRPVKSANN